MIIFCLVLFCLCLRQNNFSNVVIIDFYSGIVDLYGRGEKKGTSIWARFTVL